MQSMIGLYFFFHLSFFFTLSIVVFDFCFVEFIKKKNVNINCFRLNHHNSPLHPNHLLIFSSHLCIFWCLTQKQNFKLIFNFLLQQWRRTHWRNKHYRTCAWLSFHGPRSTCISTYSSINVAAARRCYACSPR